MAVGGPKGSGEKSSLPYFFIFLFHKGKNMNLEEALETIRTNSDCAFIYTRVGKDFMIRSTCNSLELLEVASTILDRLMDSQVKIVGLPNDKPNLN